MAKSTGRILRALCNLTHCQKTAEAQILTVGSPTAGAPLFLHEIAAEDPPGEAQDGHNHPTDGELLHQDACLQIRGGIVRGNQGHGLRGNKTMIRKGERKSKLIRQFYVLIGSHLYLSWYGSNT